VLIRGYQKCDWANSHKLRSVDELKKVTAGEGPDASHPVTMKFASSEMTKSGVIIAQYERR